MIDPSIRLLTEQDAAELLQVKPQTLAKWRMVNCGTSLRFVKVGKSIRYRLEDLESYIQRNTFINTTETYHSRKAAVESGQYVGKC